jgi:hypothetical protein
MCVGLRNLTFNKAMEQYLQKIRGTRFLNKKYAMYICHSMQKEKNVLSHYINTMRTTHTILQI